MMIEFTRINSNYEAKVTIDLLEMVNTQSISVEGGKCRLTTYMAEGVFFYSFGFMADAGERRPGHGGEWSSNAGYINKIFGIDIIECAVKEINGRYPGSYFGMSCQKSWLQTIVPPSLEYRDGLLYEKIQYPRGSDYFCSTTLNDKGELIFPDIKHMEDSIQRFMGHPYYQSHTSPRIVNYKHWIELLKKSQPNL